MQKPKKQKEKTQSLVITHPELVKEWDYEKNYPLTPEDVKAGSHQKVWWKLPYDDPKTGKHFDFEWEAPIKDRSKGTGCPYLSGKAVWPGFNDLATTNPKLAKEWHPTKNGNLKPENVAAKSGKKVWWYLPYTDPKTGKHFDFEWQAIIYDRNNGKGCPYLSGRTVWKGFNDLKTTHPQLAKEWNYEKNYPLTPEDVKAGSHQKVWWKLHYYDKNTDKYFDFEWEASLLNRSQGAGCPYLVGQAVWPEFNDLATVNPELAKEWHPYKNGNLKPTDVTAHNNKKVWWLFPYDDPKTGKHYDFEWRAAVYTRVAGKGCPYLSGQAVLKGFNDLTTVNPELARQWHPTKNGNLKPTDVTAHNNKKVWWLFPYDDPKTGKHFDFEWEAQISHRNNGIGCPYLSGRAVWKGFNDLKTVNPELAKEWHPTKNGTLKPEDVTVSTCQKVWWYLPYDDPKTGKHFDFEWEASIACRTAGNGCPYITTSKTERLVCEYLQDKSLEFIGEKKFKHKAVNKYRYDIYIPSLNLIIEADGGQHFKDTPMCKDNLEDRVNRDNIKNEFCLKNKIPILRIPYSYNPDNASKRVRTLIEGFIKTRKVPDKIIEFYKKRSKTNYANIAMKLNTLY